MVKALQDRNISAVRKLIGSHVTLFTVISGKEAQLSSELPESYLVASARFDSKSPDDEIKLNLERLSKLITISLSKPSFNPKVLKSIHNDLTDHTIRGTIAPEVVWELHYSLRKDGSLRLQRICEFDHSPRFRW